MESCMVLWCWVFLVLLPCHFYLCHGCVEKDRIGLLEVKASIDYSDGSSPSSWEEAGDDCCTWYGVKCSSINGRVQELDLSYQRNWNSYWYVNATIFVAFDELRYLNLMANSIIGCEENEGFERLSGLKKLKILDLSYNSLNASILPQLATLSSLTTLTLAYNNVGALTSIHELAPLKRLEVLDLSRNGLEGSIPPSLGTLSSLKALSLRYNQLNGSLEEHGLCRLQKLQELDLSGNELNGSLPLCLGTLTSLQNLDLSCNKFGGHFPQSIITNNTALVFLSISYNQFEGPFSFHWFSNHSKLKMIDLGCGDTMMYMIYPTCACDVGKLEIETEHPTWSPSFQLEVIFLSKSNLNRRYNNQGVIPSFLSTQSELQAVDLSHNGISGSLPTWLLKNNTKLDYLNLRNNSIMADIFRLPSHLNTSIHVLDISDNLIYGHLPTDIGMLLPELWGLNMSTNFLQGGIPPSLGDMTGLLELDLSVNNLTGEMPSNLTSIPILRLSHNKLHGKIFLDYPKLNITDFLALRLDNNEFTEIFLSNSSLLTSLDINNLPMRLNIRNNKLSGTLPRWMGELSYLHSLILGGNDFHGLIPISFCQLNLEILDISYNKLSGSIPSCFNLSQLRYLHLQGNELMGSIPSGLLQSPSLLILDIRNNNFSGSLPSWMGGLSKLRVLLLRGNQFHGSIPVEYCQLNLLRILDLSYNILSGAVPSCFSNISFGRTVTETAFFTWYERLGSELAYKVDSRIPKYMITFLEFNDEDEKQEVEFTQKRRLDIYKGGVLDFMSGIDLSCNQLTGGIPPDISNLNKLHALNLSHNRLTGPIPISFSNLMALESLDLSWNRLSGSIPSELTRLTFLAVFTVAQNNLSGRVPNTNQFATFNESDYQGNMDLCGAPLKKSCTSSTTPTQSSSTPMKEKKGDGSNGFITNLAIFLASYIVCFWGFVLPLCLNKNWRQMYFHSMDRYLLLPAKNFFLRIYVWILVKIKRIKETL